MSGVEPCPLGRERCGYALDNIGGVQWELAGGAARLSEETRDPLESKMAPGRRRIAYNTSRERRRRRSELCQCGLGLQALIATIQECARGNEDEWPDLSPVRPPTDFCCLACNTPTCSQATPVKYTFQEDFEFPTRSRFYRHGYGRFFLSGLHRQVSGLTWSHVDR